jgi:hypothetical protein
MSQTQLSEALTAIHFDLCVNSCHILANGKSLAASFAELVPNPSLYQHLKILFYIFPGLVLFRSQSNGLII